MMLYINFTSLQNKRLQVISWDIHLHYSPLHVNLA